MNVKQEAQRIREQMEADRLRDKKLHGWIVAFTAITLLFTFLTFLVWIFK